MSNYNFGFPVTQIGNSACGKACDNYQYVPSLDRIVYSSVCLDNCFFSHSKYSIYQRCAGEVGVDNCIDKMCKSDIFKQLNGNYDQCQASCKVHCNPTIPSPKK